MDRETARVPDKLSADPVHEAFGQGLLGELFFPFDRDRIDCSVCHEKFLFGPPPLCMPQRERLPSDLLPLF